MEAVLPGPVHEALGNAIEFVYSFEPLAQKTVVLVPSFLDAEIEKLADAASLDADSLSMLLGMLVCYPLGFIMKALPYGKLKHLFSFLLGAFLLQFTIGVQWIHQLVTSLVAYAMFLVLPPSVAKIAVPAWSIFYVSAGHIHRQYINYLGWDMDFTGAQMVLTMKIYSIAYNLYDGYVLAKGETRRASVKCSPYAIEKLPGIIEFLGYTFCFSNVLAGPAYEYKYYANACDGTLLYDSNGKPKGKIPSVIMPALKPLITSFICMGLFVVGNGMFPLLDPYDPQNATAILVTEEFLSKPWHYRYGYQWVSLFFIRMKYYFAWKNAEGAQNIWYAGFEGFDEEGNAKGWDISSNIDILTFETAPNLRTLSGAWNKKTANWLGRYVYMRTNGSLVATYGLSAFWHGFYPGYYLFFFSVPLVTMCERLGRKKLTPRFGNGKKFGLWYIVCALSTSFIVEYIIAAFQLLSFEWAWENWKSHYFFGHILCVVFYAVVSQIPTPKKKED
uniref:Uncharacterized protein n=1 Tax=Helicotheca tamesis TaxID=374047 RepID=A0A7S2HDC5_9STRA|mmetsp:Transcript_17181/g.23603  ORF Transcript_17181/g.23603 Transcript_17181/m.23603 type:complete len:502 (+) Transcript_17181:174-1679(+)|eukprot:CAMPEP_0185730852 /NCGR_PEP_ID=MMETSP1171-20130828/11166_1 /TAXON_ID=374046 /ORGANISM="Helicotheca tamensis, Strain CCMP826" /LENGTH=501 /DNA_ID=CAMNT_0028399989 /DNA_START=135 /DNA_END=1640 /DNA_ORIENTATION=+